MGVLHKLTSVSEVTFDKNAIFGIIKYVRMYSELRKNLVSETFR
jgi:hypothetical protein